MKPLTDLEREELMHLYDPQKAHEYYIRTRKLKGRQLGQGPNQPGNHQKTGNDPRSGKSKDQIHKDARAKQRKELAAAIHSLEHKLHALEALIRQRQQEDGAKKHKSVAKKNTAAKSKGPKTAADKAKLARDNKKYRDSHHQKIKQHAKQASAKSGGGKGSKDSAASKQHSISELKALATKVRGQLAVAKQKLAAL